MRNSLLGLGTATLLASTASSLGGGASLTLLADPVATDVTIDSLGVTQAYDISADGRWIVGSSGTPISGYTAFVWTRQTGMLSIQELLIAYGVSIPAGVSLEIALGISADGSTIVGRAHDPASKNFESRAFVVTLPDPLPDPCPNPASFDADDMVGFADLTQLLSRWGPCACPFCPEDLNIDGQVGFTDLTDFLSVWGPCD